MKPDFAVQIERLLKAAPDAIVLWAYGRFEQAYVARVLKFSMLYAGRAYDGACMLIAAIRQAGLNRYRIRDALAATRRFEGVTGTIVLDRVYSHSGPVSLATVRLGAFVYGATQPQVRF